MSGLLDYSESALFIHFLNFATEAFMEFDDSILRLNIHGDAYISGYARILCQKNGIQLSLGRHLLLQVTGGLPLGLTDLRTRSNVLAF